MSNKPINVLIIVHSIIPSVTLGILLPLIELEKRGDIKLYLSYSGKLDFLIRRLIKKCDVAIFCRNSELSDLRYLYLLKSIGKKVIFEIDDNFFDIPLSSDLGKYHRAAYRLHVLRRFFALSDLTRVYSKTLYDIATSFKANVELKQLYFYSDVLRDLPKPPKKSKTIKIVYPTTRIDDPNLDKIFFQALKNVLKKYDNQVELHLWKKTVPSLLKGCDNVVLHTQSVGYKNFIKFFYTFGFDIGLAPSLDSRFYHAKTNNKYREFGACTIPAIYSNSPPYSECVRDRENGVLAENSVLAWEEKISMLIENPELREKIALNARRDIDENYRFEDFVRVWKEDLRKVTSKKSEALEINEKEGSENPLFCYGEKRYEDDHRYAIVITVAQLLGISYEFVDRSETGCPYSELLPQKMNGTGVFFIEDESQLNAIQDVFYGFNSIIIDLTRFKGNCQSIIDTYSFIKEGSCFLLIDKNNSEIRSRLDSLTISYFPVQLGTTDLYHLNGYYGAYLEILEKPSRSFHKESYLKTELLRCKNRIHHAVFFRFIPRFQRFMLLIQWLLGRRPV
jgi:glycosyltransferase involved in cell wall biosynthesis